MSNREVRPTYTWDSSVTLYITTGEEISEADMLRETQRAVTIGDIRNRMRSKYADGFRASDMTNELKGLFAQTIIKSLMIESYQGSRQLLQDLIQSGLVKNDPTKRAGINLHYKFVEN